MAHTGHVGSTPPNQKLALSRQAPPRTVTSMILLRETQRDHVAWRLRDPRRHAGSRMQFRPHRSRARAPLAAQNFDLLRGGAATNAFNCRRSASRIDSLSRALQRVGATGQAPRVPLDAVSIVKESFR